jgi:uncharacterized delta-60 repeat protein
MQQAKRDWRDSIDMKARHVVIILIFLAVSAPLRGAVLSFQQTWGGNNLDRAEGAAVAPDGSIYSVGNTSSFSVSGDFDVFLLKYAPNGTLLLQQTYGTAGGFEDGNGVAVGPDGSVYVAGSSDNSKALLVKFDPNGALLWQRTWGGTLGETALGVATSGDGASVYIIGQTLSFGAGNIDAFLVKFDASGNLVWQRTWGGPINETGQAVAVAGDGSVYVAGDGNSFFGNDAILLKFAADGTLIWQRDWRAATGQNDESAALGVATAPDGSIYMTGRALIAGSGQNGALVKFTPDGSVVWERTWGSGLDAALGVTVAPDGTMVMTGNTGFGSGGGDAFVVRFLATTGRAIDAATWGGVDNESGESIAVASDGSVYVAGLASAPPYTFARATRTTKRPKGTFLGVPAGTVTDPGVAAATPAGTVTAVNGSTTFGGATDAFLLKVQP